MTAHLLSRLQRSGCGTSPTAAGRQQLVVSTGQTALGKQQLGKQEALKSQVKKQALPPKRGTACSVDLREGGLEPPRLAAQDPKSSASANFATPALSPVYSTPSTSLTVAGMKIWSPEKKRPNLSATGSDHRLTIHPATTLASGFQE